MSDQPREFWQEEAERERGEMRRIVLRWLLVMFVFLAVLGFALWWSSSAVHFGASRVKQTTSATYRVFGTVRDSETGQPVPWAEVADEQSGRGPYFQTTAGLYGVYELVTLAEPHQVLIRAYGYKTAVRRVGKAWYLWMPSGQQQLDVALEPE
jgi:hypothetical protein